MAEAHLGVAFSFAVTEEEGVHLSVSFEAIKAILLSGLRNWRKIGSRFAVSDQLFFLATRFFQSIHQNRIMF
jgi:hypothetical protein